MLAKSVARKHNSPFGKHAQGIVFNENLGFFSSLLVTFAMLGQIGVEFGKSVLAEIAPHPVVKSFRFQRIQVPAP